MIVRLRVGPAIVWRPAQGVHRIVPGVSWDWSQLHKSNTGEKKECEPNSNMQNSHSDTFEVSPASGLFTLASFPQVTKDTSLSHHHQ